MKNIKQNTSISFLKSLHINILKEYFKLTEKYSTFGPRRLDCSMFEHFLGKFSTLRKIETCYLMAMMMMVVVMVMMDMIVLTCYLSIFLTMCWMSLGSSGMMLPEFGRKSSGRGSSTG